jgi:N-acetylglucosaminyldiphosphoundecaprenol N-acetyl-beta-D-mannosaminyltransferase
LTEISAPPARPGQEIHFGPGPAPAGAVHVTTPTRAALLDDLGACLKAGRGFALATLNLDHAVKLRADPAFRAAYLAQTHVVADGNPIVWLCGLAGYRVELVPGSELVQPLAALAAEHGRGVALFGSTPESLDLAAKRLESAHPGLKVVAKIAPPMGFDPMGDEAARLLGQVRDSGAGLCVLALGAPKQERLAARARSLVPDCGFASIGAGVDFIAGHQTRAPAWVQKIAMEWFWRMMGNPKRLAARYAACFAILPSLGVSAVKSRG